MKRRTIVVIAIAWSVVCIAIGGVCVAIALAPSSVPMSTHSKTPAAPATSSPSSTAATSNAVAQACPTPTETVTTAAKLKSALSGARPGTVIQLAPGIYVGNFTASAIGTAASPIWLCGSAATILDGEKTASGYVIHLDHSTYWHLLGFTVRNGQKGVVADAASNNVIEALTVTGIGDEGIHLRSGSTHNLVTLNTVSNTGVLKSKYGEGIYVGSAHSNWCTYTACQPDRSDANVVSDNTISNTTAENIDIKEGTTGGTITGNSFDGTGMVQSAADSWIDVKGNGWTISSNRGANSVNDGFQTHEIVSGWGTGNRFSSNKLSVNGPGFGIHLTPSLSNIVDCSNTASGAVQGLSNVTCTN